MHQKMMMNLEENKADLLSKKTRTSILLESEIDAYQSQLEQLDKKKAQIKKIIVDKQRQLSDLSFNI